MWLLEDLVLGIIYVASLVNTFLSYYIRSKLGCIEKDSEKVINISFEKVSHKHYVISFLSVWKNTLSCFVDKTGVEEVKN